MVDINKILGSINITIGKAKLNVLNQALVVLNKRSHNILRDWKAEVRMLLSVPHRKGTKSNGLYPNMRTGSLRKSLSYRVLSSRITGTKSALIRAQVIWDKDPKHTGAPNADYGSHLNSSSKFKDRRFFGWRDRTYRLLYKRLTRMLYV